MRECLRIELASLGVLKYMAKIELEYTLINLKQQETRLVPFQTQS
jgi:hypothetical protein